MAANAWPHHPGPTMLIRKEMVEWKFIELLYVTSNTSITLFKGYMKLLMVTNSSPAQSGKFPEKTIKSNDVVFPISIYFPLDIFLRKKSKRQGRKWLLSCDLTTSHFPTWCFST